MAALGAGYQGAAGFRVSSRGTSRGAGPAISCTAVPLLASEHRLAVSLHQPTSRRLQLSAALSNGRDIATQTARGGTGRGMSAWGHSPSDGYGRLRPEHGRLRPEHGRLRPEHGRLLRMPGSVGAVRRVRSKRAVFVAPPGAALEAFLPLGFRKKPRKTVADLLPCSGGAVVLHSTAMTPTGDGSG